MANYYVRNDGNNSNTGTGPATNQAWQTIAYAFANMTLTTGVNTLYVAPGVYRESPTLTVTPTATNTLVITGDPTASQFTGITANQVRVTGASLDTTTMSAGTRFNLGSKSYVTIQNFYIEQNAGAASSGAIISAGDFLSIRNNVIFSYYLGGTTGSAIQVTPPAATGNNIVIENNILVGTAYGIYVSLQSSSSGVSGVVIRNCRISTGYSGNGYGIVLGVVSGANMASVTISNCTISQSAAASIYIDRGNTTDKHIVQNCIISLSSIGIQSGTSNQVTQRNNILLCQTNLSNVATDATTITSDFLGIDYGQALLQGFGNLAPFGTSLNSRNTAFGTATSAPTTDMLGIAWTGATPDVGTTTYRSLQNIGFYLPTERNASTITIAPGSTSQSIELYLGATGLTASTSGLTARYNRTRTASVSIPLVARTIAQAWTAGGFAEVDATNMPGVYRLDLPDDALAVGADDVTVVVRGASGTNGAVMTVKLSSGGLTAAQTASAVLDAVGSSYVTAGSIGYAIQNSNVASISGSTSAADELEGALLHNGTDYISAELVTPVTSAALVRMGPFEVRADGLGASDPLDVQKGAQHGIDIQCVDNNGAGIDITSATVTAKVYNSGATLVDTYACTATYAADGRATFTIDTTVTNTPGTYTATITRTTGASDTQVFGPLRIYVRDI